MHNAENLNIMVLRHLFLREERKHLIVPDEIKNFELFRTELGTVLEFCQCSNDKIRMKQLIQEKKEESVRLEKETYDMLKECFRVEAEELEEKGEERLGKLICVLLSKIR